MNRTGLSKREAASRDRVPIGKSGILDPEDSEPADRQ